MKALVTNVTILSDPTLLLRTESKIKSFLISNFRRVLNVVCFPFILAFYLVCFLLGDSPASKFYMPKFRNTVCSIFIGRQVRVV